MSGAPLQPATAKQLHAAVSVAIQRLESYERYASVVSLLVANLFPALEHRRLMQTAFGADEQTREALVRAKLELASRGLSPQTAGSVAAVLRGIVEQLAAEADPDDGPGGAVMECSVL